MSFQGQVKFFNNDKGYGFIVRDDGQPDVFVHFRSIIGEGYRSLGEGDTVKFNVVPGKGGKPQAEEVEVIQSASGNNAQY